MRPTLLFTLALALVAAGCAEGDIPGAMRATPSPEEAAALFAQAAGNVPDQYGLDMVATKEGKELMTAKAVFDEPRQTAYFTMRVDPSVANAGDGMGMDFPAEGFSMYTSPEGSAFIMGTNVILTPPDGDSMWSSQARQNNGLSAVTDPEALLEELRAQNVTVTSVTATTLRGKAALQLETSYTDEEGTHEMTIYLFRDPTRVARIEMTVPADEDAFGGALMTMDLLYGDEIRLSIPADVQRALGLRYQSDRVSFGGFGGWGGGDEDGPETWTFQASAGVPLSEVEAEVFEGAPDEESAPLWSMRLSEGTRSADGLTLTYADVDGDGKVSQGDTLTIERGDGAEHLSVALKDTQTGLRVVPGAGFLLAALGVAAAALVAGRRR